MNLKTFNKYLTHRSLLCLCFFFFFFLSNRLLSTILTESADESSDILSTLQRIIRIRRLKLNNRKMIKNIYTIILTPCLLRIKKAKWFTARNCFQHIFTYIILYRFTIKTPVDSERY